MDSLVVRAPNWSCVAVCTAFAGGVLGQQVLVVHLLPSIANASAAPIVSYMPALAPFAARAASAHHVSLRQLLYDAVCNTSAYGGASTP